MKYRWKIAEAPTGRYRSFYKRAWPRAFYSNDKQSPAAMITCEETYRSVDAKSGKHPPLRVSIAEHSVTPWRWRRLTESFETLDKAKAAVDAFLSRNPDWMPKE